MYDKAGHRELVMVAGTWPVKQKNCRDMPNKAGPQNLNRRSIYRCKDKSWKPEERERDGCRDVGI